MTTVGVCGLGLGINLAYYLASVGKKVVGVDIDKRTFQEPSPKADADLDAYKRLESVKQNLVGFSDKFEYLASCEYIMVYVTTPREDGRLSLKNVEDAIQATNEHNSTATYLVLSTLPMGGMERLHRLFPRRRILYCPPMAREGQFVETFRRPPSGWQLVGTEKQLTEMLDIVGLYRSILAKEVTVILVDDVVVEAVKLVTNLMLAVNLIMANNMGSWLGDPVIVERVCSIVNAYPGVGKGYFTPGGKASEPGLERDLAELLNASEPSALAEIVRVLNKLNGTGELVKVLTPSPPT